MAQVTDPAEMLSIDPDNLDVNCFDQPKLVRQWARQLALAEKKAKDAENRRKLVWAELRQRVRESPGAFNLQKVTADTVDDAAVSSPEYQEALQAETNAEYEKGLIKANVDALKSRDYQLTNAGELLKLGYFAAPRVDSQTRDRYMKAKQTVLSDEINKAAQDSKKKPISRK